jgi:hypothetical protein
VYLLTFLIPRAKWSKNIRYLQFTAEVLSPETKTSSIQTKHSNTYAQRLCKYKYISARNFGFKSACSKNNLEDKGYVGVM